MAEIPEGDRASEMTIDADSMPITKTLGLSWNSKDDVFMIPMTSPGRLQLTKRNVLRKMVTVFNPLGFIGLFDRQPQILFRISPTPATCRCSIQYTVRVFSP